MYICMIVHIYISARLVSTKVGHTRLWLAALVHELARSMRTRQETEKEKEKESIGAKRKYLIHTTAVV